MKEKSLVDSLNEWVENNPQSGIDFTFKEDGLDSGEGFRKMRDVLLLLKEEEGDKKLKRLIYYYTVFYKRIIDSSKAELEKINKAEKAIQVLKNMKGDIYLSHRSNFDYCISVFEESKEFLKEKIINYLKVDSIEIVNSLSPPSSFSPKEDCIFFKKEDIKLYNISFHNKGKKIVISIL